MSLFRKLHVWIDHEARSGPEAMAVDELVLEFAEAPVLRVYRWAGDWVSLGYFGEIAVARAAFPGVNLVRRWTGGGTVDHRADWTYSLIVPNADPLATSRGADSYRKIHEILTQVIEQEGLYARISEGAEETGAALCFSNPVTHDILGQDGSKLAGAGQRRTRSGLLHQGSVAVPCRDGEASRKRTWAFASMLCRHPESFSYTVGPIAIAEKVSARYACGQWTERR